MQSISQSFISVTARNLAASIDHTPKPRLHDLPHLIPEWRQSRCNIPFHLACRTSLHLYLDFCGDRIIGSFPVDESCSTVIGQFIAIHGLSIPLFSPRSNRGRLSQPSRRVLRRMLSAFRHGWEFSPPSPPPITFTPTVLQSLPSSPSQTTRNQVT